MDVQITNGVHFVGWLLQIIVIIHGMPNIKSLLYPCDFSHVRTNAKSEYWLRHVRPSARMEQLGSH